MFEVIDDADRVVSIHKLEARATDEAITRAMANGVRHHVRDGQTGEVIFAAIIGAPRPTLPAPKKPLIAPPPTGLFLSVAALVVLMLWLR